MTKVRDRAFASPPFVRGACATVARPVFVNRSVCEFRVRDSSVCECT